MSENNTTIDPVPSGSDLEGSAQPRQNSERGRSDPMGTFPVPSAVVPITPLPHKKFPLLLLFLIPVLTIVAVISIYVLIQARIMYQQTVAVATPAPTPIPSTDPTADWQTYSNIKYKYSIKYPTLFSLVDLTEGEQIEIYYQPNRETSVGELLIEKINKVPTNISSYQDAREIAGIVAKCNGSPDLSKTWCILENKLISITLIHSQNDDNNYRKTLSDILSTFKFTD